MRALWLLLLAGMAWGGDLTDRLHERLSAGEPPGFSDLELALIAGGAEDAEALAKAVADYEALVDKLALGNRELKQKPQRRAALALKNVVVQLRKMEPGETYSGLLDLVSGGRYNALTATYLYVDLAKRADLKGSVYSHDEKGFSQYFLDGDDASARELAAALFVHRALAAPDERAQTAMKALQVSRMLAPESAYGLGDADLRLYNRAFQLYEAGAVEAAARFAVGAAARFPNLKEYGPLIYNIGVKMFQAAEAGGDREAAAAWGERLAPYTGQLRQEFDDALATLYFNGAVALYNQGKMEAALTMAERANLPLEEEGARNLRIGAYEALAEQAFQARDAEASRRWIDALAAIDPERAEYLETRFRQLDLKTVDESGDLAKALSLAERDLDTEIGRKNYLSVLARHVKSLYDSGKTPAALEALDAIPAAVADSPVLDDLRLNSYSAWLKPHSAKDFRAAIPIYETIFADKKLELTDAERAAFLEGYGNALYFQIEDLIAERDFQAADRRSREALKRVPNHAGLQALRQKVETILKRIQD